MQHKPHVIFRKHQTSVAFELPNDVFYNFMSILKRTNDSLAIENGYRLIGDDLISMALEDFCDTYLEHNKALLKRLGVHD